LPKIQGKNRAKINPQGDIDAISEKVAVINTIYESKKPIRRYLHNRRKKVIASLIRKYSDKKGCCLDIGTGVGTYLPYLHKRFNKITGIDNEPDLLNYVRNLFGKHENIEFYEADALHQPFEDNTFDFILCSEVLEHVSCPATLLKEVARIKKPGGIFILSTPQKFSFPELISKVFFSQTMRPFTRIIIREPIWDPGHISLLTSGSLQCLLKESGFTIESVNYIGAFIPFLSFLLGEKYVDFLRERERKWQKGILRPLLWTQIYVLR